LIPTISSTTTKLSSTVKTSSSSKSIIIPLSTQTSIIPNPNPTPNSYIQPKIAWSFDFTLTDAQNNQALSASDDSTYTYVNDHTNDPTKAAIHLNQMYLQAPANIYFNKIFTITAWINYISFNNNNNNHLIPSTLIDFGNTNQQDSIVLATMPNSNQMSAVIFQDMLESNNILGSTGLALNTWYYVAYVYNGTAGYLYLNGHLVSSASQLAPNGVERMNCFIGKSNSNSSDSLTADAIYDEIRIYDVALTKEQITSDMNDEPIPISVLPFTYKHIGCYADQFRRDLAGYYFDMTLTNTPQACMKACNSVYYKYAGVQYNYQCWCGNSYNNYGPAYNCHLTCPNSTNDGDLLLLCGGAWSNDIYEIMPIDSSDLSSNNEFVLSSDGGSGSDAVLNSSTICENSMLKIDCPKDNIIQIKYAMYGRVSITKCQSGKYQYDKCNLIQTNAVANACNGLKSCRFHVDSNALNQDPCPDYSKYLDISWSCRLPL